MKVLIIPTYNEKETLPIFLDQILERWNKNDLIIISDDSEESHREAINQAVKTKVEAGYKVFLLAGSIKGGRGAAVRRVMAKLLEEKVNFSHIIEADADGSHRAEDIFLLRDFDPSKDFLIGSRYLKQSTIQGWSISRRILSRCLNLLIPKITGVKTSDITNGLRRYSKKSVQILLNEPSLNSGFIYLSEQALRLSMAEIEPFELPIMFMPRVSGTSSVTFKDLLLSLSGLMRIWRMKRKIR